VCEGVGIGGLLLKVRITTLMFFELVCTVHRSDSSIIDMDDSGSDDYGWVLIIMVLLGSDQWS
jgi:hypothetical protein